MFTRPPVHEAVLDLAFREVPALGERSAGFHAALDDAYPKRDESQPVLPPLDEHGNAPQFVFALGEPPRRAWRISTDDQFVLQFQADRLILNWRKTSDDVAYPTYDALRDRFGEALRLFLAHVVSDETSDFTPTRCEFAYENTLPSDVVEEAGGIHSAIPGIGPSLTINDDVGTLTDLGVAAAYGFTADGAEGRTHVNLRTAVERNRGTKIFALRIASSTVPSHNGEAGIVGALNTCHEQALKTFLALTDDQYQMTHWGKE